MITYQPKHNAIENAKALETEDMPVAVRGFQDRVMLAQGDQLIGLPRHRAEQLMRQIELILNNGEELPE